MPKNPARFNKNSFFQIERAISDVGLEDKKDALAKQLSGGQKRKLSVAVALIGDPKVGRLMFQITELDFKFKFDLLNKNNYIVLYSLQIFSFLCSPIAELKLTKITRYDVP